MRKLNPKNSGMGADAVFVMLAVVAAGLLVAMLIT